jgi:NodT family efflux transporter outer membrane factor (OMF) lipoprotein
MRTLALLLVAALSLACVPSPARRLPGGAGVEVPGRWSSETDTVVESIRPDWWSEFSDPTLDEIIREALENNRDLQIAAARLDAAAAEARIAGANLKPMVDAGFNAGRSRQVFLGIPIEIPGQKVLGSTTTSYGVSLNVAWEADLWGKLRAGKRAALSELEASRADLAGARLSIVGQTAKTWFALTETRQQVELAEETVESYRSTAERVESRYERGIRSSLDLRLTLSNLATAEASLELARDRLQRAARQLEILLGRYPAGALEGAPTLPPPTSSVPEGLPATLVSRRPDLVAAEYRLAGADSRLVQARTALYPSFRLTASGGSTSKELDDLLDGDFSVWSLAGGLLQPIFQGGRLRAGVDLARSGSEQALAAYANVLLRAFGEVESTLASESILARREKALAVATEQSVAARKLAEDRYDAGLEGIVTVLDAQRRALSAESQLLLVRRSRLDNRVDLYLALGGGFGNTGPEPGNPTSGDSTSIEESRES